MPIVLLHGWPGFWYVWRKNIQPLAEEFDAVVPGPRGFGETKKAQLPEPPSDLLDDLVEDLRGLADALGLGEFGIANHVVGSFVAQRFAHRYSERPTGLFFTWGVSGDREALAGAGVRERGERTVLRVVEGGAAGGR